MCGITLLGWIVSLDCWTLLPVCCVIPPDCWAVPTDCWTVSTDCCAIPPISWTTPPVCCAIPPTIWTTSPVSCAISSDCWAVSADEWSSNRGTDSWHWGSLSSDLWRIGSFCFMVVEEVFFLKCDFLFLHLDKQWFFVDSGLVLITDRNKMVVRISEMTKKIQSGTVIKDFRSHFFNIDTALSIHDWNFNGSLSRSGNERYWATAGITSSRQKKTKPKTLANIKRMQPFLLHIL